VTWPQRAAKSSRVGAGGYEHQRLLANARSSGASATRRGGGEIRHAAAWRGVARRHILSVARAGAW